MANDQARTLFVCDSGNGAVNDHPKRRAPDVASHPTTTAAGMVRPAPLDAIEVPTPHDLGRSEGWLVHWDEASTAWARKRHH